MNVCVRTNKDNKVFLSYVRINDHKHFILFVYIPTRTFIVDIHRNVSSGKALLADFVTSYAKIHIYIIVQVMMAVALVANAVNVSGKDLFYSYKHCIRNCE